jgi:hypothetical protein
MTQCAPTQHNNNNNNNNKERKKKKETFFCEGTSRYSSASGMGLVCKLNDSRTMYSSSTL